MAKWTGTVEALVHDYQTSEATLDAWWEIENSSKRKRVRNNEETTSNKRPKTAKEITKEVSEDAKKAVERAKSRITWTENVRTVPGRENWFPIVGK